jgi:hypothetical protein
MRLRARDGTWSGRERRQRHSSDRARALIQLAPAARAIVRVIVVEDAPPAVGARDEGDALESVEEGLGVGGHEGRFSPAMCWK